MKRVVKWGGLEPLLPSLAALSALGIFFYVAKGITGGGWHDWYLIWNLFLAWLPLVFAVALSELLRKLPWSDWRPVVLTVLWLGFLPNSFYIVSDLIHLADHYYTDRLFTAVMFSSYALAGLAVGFISLGLVHRELRHRLKPATAHLLILGVLLLSSFAIYIGRDLRWNSWDIVFNPAGLLFDVSDPLIDPSAHPRAITTTATFFIFLTVLYYAGRSGVDGVRRLPKG